MVNLIQNTTGLAMSFVAQYLEPGDAAVDATCGNGHDTVELLKLGAEKVYGFDIQEMAIENTRHALITENLYDENRIKLIRDSHENMADYIKGKIGVAVFNLGYLPAADKTITTKPASTIRGIEKAAGLLKKNGLICITMYSGHPGGEEEKQAVLDYGKALDPREYHVVCLNMLNQRNHPPEILLITKKE